MEQEIKQLDSQSVNGPSHVPVPMDMFTSSHEHTPEDLAEVDPRSEGTEQAAGELENAGEDRKERCYEWSSKVDPLSPLLSSEAHSVGQNSIPSLVYTIGQKRPCSQSIEQDETEEEEDEEEEEEEEEE